MKTAKAAIVLAGLVCVVLSGPGSGAVLEAQPRPEASELLQKVRSTYSSLGSFRDRGEIEATHPLTGGAERHLFDLAARADGAYRLTLQSAGPDGERIVVVWREGKQVSVFDSRAGKTRRAVSLPAEVAAGYGEAGLEALVVPAVLAGSPDGLAAVPGAAVEGPEPCGAGNREECWVVALPREGGAQSRLWVDVKASLVRQVEVRLPGGRERSRIRVWHQGPAVNQPLTAADLVPAGVPAAEPEPERAAGADLSNLRQEEVFVSEVTVAVAPLVVRVVTGGGEPLLGLKPEDFAVRAGKREVPVLSVDWTSKAEMFPEEAAPEGGDGTAADLPAPAPSKALELLRKAGPPPGKRVLFFVQADLHPTRAKGHLALLPRVEKLLGTLEPGDRLALVSFDSHLRLWLDWTGDREDLREALRQSVRAGGESSTLAGDGPADLSLARFLGAEAGKEVANPEQALELVADALASYEGEKVVMFVGWGLGRRGEARYAPKFRRAADKLNEAKASVFVLDVTYDDSHDLAAGLETMALTTGGTYASTYENPDRAIKQVAQAISGYYVLTFDADELPQDGKPLRIELRNKKQGRVLVRASAASRSVVRGSY